MEDGTKDDVGRPLETGGLFTLVLPVALHGLDFETEIPAELRKHTAVQYTSSMPDPAFGLSDGDDPPLAIGLPAIREFFPRAEALLQEALDTAMPVFTHGDDEVAYYAGKGEKEDV